MYVQFHLRYLPCRVPCRGWGCFGSWALPSFDPECPFTNNSNVKSKQWAWNPDLEVLKYIGVLQDSPYIFVFLHKTYTATQHYSQFFTLNIYFSMVRPCNSYIHIRSNNNMLNHTYLDRYFRRIYKYINGILLMEFFLLSDK